MLTDLSITIELTLFLILFFAFGFTLVIVVTKVASSSDPRLKISNWLDPAFICTLSDVNSSVVPSLLIRRYLSGVNGKKLSFDSVKIADDNLLSTMLTCWVFLITRDASLSCTSEILLFDNSV